MTGLILFSIFFLISSIVPCSAEYTHAIRELTPLEKETLSLLKKEFSGDILDANLKTLRQLADSPEYKKFLEKAYPLTKPIPAFAEIIDFQEVIHNRLPPRERYLTFYTEQFRVQKVEKVTDAEHFLIHNEVTNAWIYQAREFGRELGSSGADLSRIAPPQLMGTAPFQQMLAIRFHISGDLELEAIMTLVVRHIKLPILAMTKEHLTADARWIQTLLEKHGTTEGMLWVALQDPILFERIRHAFTTNSTFLEYVRYALAAEAHRSRSKEK